MAQRPLINHCYRSYYLAEMLATRQGMRFDREVLYLSALLHDLGLTERFDADVRFEVRGADAAQEFVKAHGLSDDKVETVWDAIALHTSPAIAERKGPEVTLVQMGAACDVMGVGYETLDPERVAALIVAFPRENWQNVFLNLILSDVRRRPAAVTLTWMSDVGRQLLDDIQCPTWNEMVAASPYDE